MAVLCPLTSVIMQMIELNLETLLKYSIILTNGVRYFKKQRCSIAKCNKIKTTWNITKAGKGHSEKQALSLILVNDEIFKDSTKVANVFNIFITITKN